MIHAMNGTDTLLFAASMTNSATTSASLDIKGCDWVTIRIPFLAELNTNAVGPTISLLESDDTVVTNHATIVANRTNEDLTTAKEVRYEIDARGRKRYLRLTVTTATATNDNISVAAIATLSRKSQTPSAHSLLADAVVVV